MTVDGYSMGQESRKRPHEDSSSEDYQPDDIDLDSMLTQRPNDQKQRINKIRKQLYRQELRQSQYQSQRPTGQVVQPYAGYIKRVTLRNFMSHANFELEFGPRLNFIIGHNGSGKSAILTAICVCLGARATDTNRGSSLKSLIKEGTNSSTISIVLSNEGEDAFEPGKYGKEIIIERTIKKDNISSPYIIKSETGKKISTKKQDLDSILDTFNIAVSNPMSFLSQDAARSFLTASSDEQKFSYFMKGTQMQEIIENFYRTKEQLASMDLKLISMKGTIQGLREKEIAAAALHERLDSSKNIDDEIRKTTGKYGWVEAEEVKGRIKELEKKITEDLKVKHHIQSQIDQVEAEIQHIEKEEILVNEQLKTIYEDFQNAKNDFEQKKAEAESYLRSAEAANNDYQSKLDKLKRDQIELNKIDLEIAQEMDKINQKQGGSREVLEAQLQQLEQERDSLHEKSNIIQSKLSQISLDENSEKEELDGRLRGLTEELQSIDQYIKTLTNTNNADPLVGYPDQFRKLVKLMESNSNQFRIPPLGPLGRYINIKPAHKEWGPFIEATIGTGLNTFVVQSFDDLRILQRMARQVNCNAPLVFRRSERFDFSSGQPDRRFLTILDTLEFQKEEVMYSLIDLQHIESIIVEKDRFIAQQALESGARNIHRAISMSPNGKSGNSSSINKNGGFRMDPLTVSFSYPKITVKNPTNDLPRVQRERQQIYLDHNQLKAQRAGVSRKYADQSKNLRTERANIDQQLKIIERDRYQLKKKLEDDSDSGRLEELQHQRSVQEGKVNFCQNSEIPTAEEMLQKADEKKLMITEEYKQVKYQVSQIKVSKDNLERFIKEKQDEAHLHRNSIDKNKRGLEKVDYKIEERKNEINNSEERIKQLVEYAERYCSEEEASSIESNDLNFLSKRLAKLNKDKEEFANELGKDPDQIVKDYTDARAEHQHAKHSFSQVRDVKKNLQSSLELRINTFIENRLTTFTAANEDFGKSLAFRGFTGNLKFDEIKEKLSMTVKTKNDKIARHVDSLSGGEKSFSQIAFLLATWKPMRSRIKGLDEFDVFMDQVNRKIGMRLMLTRLSQEQKAQTIFITPQDIGQIADLDEELVRIHRIRDPRATQH